MFSVVGGWLVRKCTQRVNSMGVIAHKSSLPLCVITHNGGESFDMMPGLNVLRRVGYGGETGWVCFHERMTGTKHADVVKLTAR